MVNAAAQVSTQPSFRSCGLSCAEAIGLRSTAAAESDNGGVGFGESAPCNGPIEKRSFVRTQVADHRHRSSPRRIRPPRVVEKDQRTSKWGELPCRVHTRVRTQKRKRGRA